MKPLNYRNKFVDRYTNYLIVFFNFKQPVEPKENQIYIKPYPIMPAPLTAGI